MRGMTIWRDFYAKTTNPFGAKGPFYGPAGHHGADFAVGTHGVVPAYFTGTCVENAHSGVLGYYSVFKRADGKYAGFAHLLVGSRRNVGEAIKPGQSVGKAAGRGDDHGSAWAGAHCHTTESAYVDGIWDGRTVDPVPAINRARIGAAMKAPHPSKGRTQTAVKKGEGGIAVAKRVGITYDRLRALNPNVKDWSALKVGQRVWTS